MVCTMVFGVHQPTVCWIRYLSQIVYGLDVWLPALQIINTVILLLGYVDSFKYVQLKV